MDIAIEWVCLNFARTVLSRDVCAGEPIVRKWTNDILHEICLLSDLDIPDLEKEVE